MFLLCCSSIVGSGDISAVAIAYMCSTQTDYNCGDKCHKGAKYRCGKLRGVVINLALLVCKVHWAILAVVEEGAAGAVNRQHIKIGAYPVALYVVISKKPTAHVPQAVVCVCFCISRFPLLLKFIMKC